MILKISMLTLCLATLTYGQYAPGQPVPQHYPSMAPSTQATLGQAYQELATRLGAPGPAQSFAPQQYAPQFQPQQIQYVPQAPAQQTLAAGPAPQQIIHQQQPTSYGWQVQHQSAAPQPQAAAAPQQLPPQYLQQAAPVQAPAQYAPQPQPQYAAPAPPQELSPLHRPASVHYAQIGENLAGDYRFGYRTGDGNSFREESRLPDGTVQGQYGFVDADGKQRVVKYTAGVGGFQVLNGDGPAQPAAHAAPVARAAPQPSPVQVAIPQWAQGSLGAQIPAAPQPQPQPQYAAPAPIAAAQPQPVAPTRIYLASAGPAAAAPQPAAQAAPNRIYLARAPTPQYTIVARPLGQAVQPAAAAAASPVAGHPAAAPAGSAQVYGSHLG